MPFRLLDGDCDRFDVLDDAYPGYGFSLSPNDEDACHPDAATFSCTDDSEGTVLVGDRGRGISVPPLRSFIGNVAFLLVSLSLRTRIGGEEECVVFTDERGGGAADLEGTCVLLLYKFWPLGLLGGPPLRSPALGTQI